MSWIDYMDKHFLIKILYRQWISYVFSLKFDVWGKEFLSKKWNRCNDAYVSHFYFLYRNAVHNYTFIYVADFLCIPFKLDLWGIYFLSKDSNTWQNAYVFCFEYLI